MEDVGVGLRVMVSIALEVDVIGGFLNLLASTPIVADKMMKTRLIFRLIYKEPDAVIVVDCSGDEPSIRPGDNDTKAVITLTMKADLAHRFWFGKVNLTMAITRGKIAVRGPVAKLLRLLPVLKPSYSMYPKYLDDNGFGELNILR